MKAMPLTRLSDVHSVTINLKPYIHLGMKIAEQLLKQKLFEMKKAFRQLEVHIRKNHSKMDARDTANHLFAYPITTPTLFGKELGVHYQTASKYLSELKDAGF